MRLLVTDVETTGLDVKEHQVIEIAAALYDTTARAMIWCGSVIVPAASNPSEEFNGITQAMLDAAHALDRLASEERVRIVADEAINALILMTGCADVILAHNAEFDRPFVTKVLRLDMRPVPLPWVCSFRDLKWPRAGTSRKLGHLAVDHGIPFGRLHRAMADVLLLCELLTAQDDLEAQLVEAMRPRGVFIAHDIPYDRKQEAKDAGFRWKPAGDEEHGPSYKAAKYWWRELPLDSPITATPDRRFEIRLLFEVNR